MKKVKFRKILILVVIILLVCLLFYSFFNIFEKHDKDTTNKEEEKDTIVEVVEDLKSINNQHCDKGYCVENFKISKLNDGTFQLSFIFENTNDVALNDGCFKLAFSDDVNYVSCYRVVEAGATVENIYSVDQDIYSEFDDYNLITLTGSELTDYYSYYDVEVIEN